MVAIVATTLLTACQEFDIAGLMDDFNNLKDRVTALEESCEQMNANIVALQTITTALEQKDYVKGTTPISNEDGEVIGYTITFGKGNPITIYHGENGLNGYTPIIGAKADVDGIYYWTLDGNWLTDGSGNKIKAQGVDGKDGADGQDGVDGKDGADGKDGVDGQDGKDGLNGTDGKDGVNGTDGKDGADGITPRLKIENGYWYISYDNGASWSELGKATGENGANGDNIFKSVAQDDSYVYFTMSDGSVITLPKFAGTETPDEPVNNKIFYTATEEVGFATKAFDVNVVSHEFDETTGEGVITFDGDVTKIGDSAFVGCSSLTSIILPDGVTSIEDCAFMSCSSLTSIILPEGVTSIGYNAFSHCSSLTSITIPEGVTSIGEDAFSHCI